jgi:hypothetical protein
VLRAARVAPVTVVAHLERWAKKLTGIDTRKSNERSHILWNLDRGTVGRDSRQLGLGGLRRKVPRKERSADRPVMPPHLAAGFSYLARIATASTDNFARVSVAHNVWRVPVNRQVSVFEP